MPDKTRLSSRKFSSTHRIVYDRTSQLYKEEKVKWNGWYTGQKTVGLDLNLSEKEHCGQALICRQKASRNQNAKEGIMIGIEGTPPLKRSKSINGADMSHSIDLFHNLLTSKK